MKLLMRLWWLLPIVIIATAIGSAQMIVTAKTKTRAMAVSADTPLPKSAHFSYDCRPTEPTSLSCEQQRYAQLAMAQGPVATFTQLKSAYSTDPTIRTNCHQLTHAIGRALAEQAATVESAYNQGDNFCWSGYYHGVMETMIRKQGSEHIVATVTSICADIAKTKPYSFYHYNCVHGLGHGLMSITGNQLFSSLSLCDKYSDDWQRQSCQSGVYMENVMAGENPNDHTDFLKADQPLYPCTAVEDTYKTQCYYMQTSQALKVLNYDYARVFQLCATTGQYAAICYQSLGRDASGNSTSDVAKTIQTCRLGTTSLAQQNCVIGAVKDFISYYHGTAEATNLCRAMPAELQGLCLTTMNEYYKSF